MKVLIVAKTRMGKGACIGGITQDGKSVRLIPADIDVHDDAGQEYEVGDLWEVESTPAPDITPPHVENIIVHEKRRLPHLKDPIAIIKKYMPPKVGGPAELYEGLMQSTLNGSLYIAESGGLPPYSTTFWRADQPLVLDTTSKRIRYRYPTEDGGRTLTFVGFQEPLRTIPAGTLLRVSLAHLWRPKDDSTTEYRCYVQLSGWFLEEEDNQDFDQFNGQATPPSEIDTPLLDNTPQLSDATSSLHLLQTVFGYDEFRPLQAEIIENILNRHDTLIIMPTGGGKSLCYQLPALLFDGLTVVVSPLISLMQDQVTQLQHLGVSAVFLNSTLSHNEYLSTIRQIKCGAVKLLYLAPETLLRPETLLMLDECQMDCLAIDEAHCISQWGHDFRPEYRQLAQMRERFPSAVCVALTATATSRVQTDISQTLGFRNEDKFISSFDRKNLVIAVESKVNLYQQIFDFLANHRDQSGIIYCATKLQVDTLHQKLVADDFSALPYHAGLDAETREQNQTAFIRDDVRIMVATIAFGMGIDKPDVRFVVHADLPKNIESYYQEIGRAGRDGLRADCLLLFSHGDAHTIQYFIQQGADSERDDRSKRLTALVDWATSADCRRIGLLGYFGEKYDIDNCQMCDNCLIEATEKVDLTIPAQKFLSCVSRTGEIFGISHIIKVLRGSRAKKVLQFAHDKLSTYSIGREYSIKQWNLLVQQFIQQQLLTKNIERGSIQLTDKGWAVLKGEQVWGIPVETQVHRHTHPDKTVEYDSVLFEELRAKRKELADTEGVPPYVIFFDRTLKEVATYFPQSKESFEKIHGIGQMKVEKYADNFLPIICTYCQQHELTERPKSTSRVGRSTTGLKSRSQEVGERFQAGESIAELVQSYGIKRGTIIEHLSKYAKAGNPLPVERLHAESSLSDEIKNRVLEIFDELDPDYLKPVFDAFNETINYEELHLIRAIYWTVHSNLSEKPKSTRTIIPRVKAKSRSQEVGERFQAGESIAELMQAYEVKRERIIKRLSKYVQAGNALSVERLYAESPLSSDIKDRVLEAFDELGPDYLKPVFDTFNETVSYEELHLIRTIYWTVHSNGSLRKRWRRYANAPTCSD